LKYIDISDKSWKSLRMQNNTPKLIYFKIF